MTDPNNPGKEIETPSPGEYPEVTPVPGEKESPDIPQEAPPMSPPVEMPDVVPGEQPLESPPGEIPDNGETVM